MRKPINGYKPTTFDLGLMKKRITIETNISIKGEIGGSGDTWGTFKDTWTFPQSITNEWLLRMGQKSTGDNKNFVVRYDEAINKNMRIVWKGDSYRILSIDDFNEGEWFLKIECEGNKYDA